MYFEAVEREGCRAGDKERDIHRGEECVSGAFWGLFAALINIRYE